MKEISPLLAQNGQNTALFGVPGRRIFHGTPQHLTQGRFFFHPSSSPAPQAGQNSPCSAPSAHARETVRPAPPKLPKNWLFWLGGRVLSRRWVPQPPHNTCRSPRLKPMAPMQVDHCHEMKPMTPLLPRNGQFLAIIRPQRRRRFHQTPNRAASSQQDAQTLMLAASAVALIASGSSTVRVCQEIKEAPARCPHRRSPGRHRHLPDAAPRIPRPRRRGPHPPAVLPGLG